ncbi:pentatricopeptide repeat-containing protein At4g32430, mitochondrial [Actinidia eriantha]|uniref:pentatricopeptide repeat-containing protein At4g32430, mitochondrial n=1 Tax=Actinidia eriantha TaxID=165200 RepID=UPI00258D8682|nr:pentatricopeptide repeat-containing protein At4g32430, mitochondrial [Actinidia eriantha]
MITRHLNFKTLQGTATQRLKGFKKIHSSHHEHQLFYEITQPKFPPFKRYILACLQKNSHLEALDIFNKQIQSDFSSIIDEVTIAMALKACRGNLKLGRKIHDFATVTGLVSYLSVSNSLMNMYCKSGQFGQALCIFDKLKNPDIVSWNTVISGFQNVDDALNFACRMNSAGIVFDAVTYTVVLAHCADHEEFLYGIQLHTRIRKCGLGCEVYIGNALITMYSKWGRIVEAERVFDEMPERDLVSWNAMLSGYAQAGNYGVEAIWAFVEMVREGMKLDHVSFTGVVSACVQERNVELGRQIHSLAIKRGYMTKRRYEAQVSVCNVLIAMYSKCEFVKDATLVFESMSDRNVISWTTMISMIEENAMPLFNEMRLDGIYPNDVTFVALIHSITVKNLVEEGRMVHGFCLKSSFLSELNVANSFITMYAKFESMEDSEKIFEELKYTEIVSWNALISGYAQNSSGQETLKAFLSATLELIPNQFTFGSVLSAIGATESISLKHGQRCHSSLIKLGLNTDPIVSSALLDMYAKRGNISESLSVFDDMTKRTEVAWTAIISAHARHGDYDSVMSLFEEMEKSGVKPDSITFLSVLTACGRKGMVDMGRQIFESMVKTHLIEPSAEHYSCMVDMLGRAGRLKEAEVFVDRIPGGPRLSVLQSLLGSCRTYGNVEMGKRVAEALMEMKPQESGSYVLISNLYAEKGDWEKVAKIRRGMRNKGVKKEVGFSWADVGDAGGSLYLHGFSSDDKSHSQTEEICRMAECIGSEMKFLESERQRNMEERVCTI